MDLRCSITGEVYEDPVICCDGLTYERASIERWFEERRVTGKPVTSPLTGLELPSLRLTPNITVRQGAQEWRARCTERTSCAERCAITHMW
jgi:hypothetical protein